MISNIESTKGLVFSQRLMLALVEKGMPRQDAYRLQQSHAHITWDEGTDFRELIKNDSIVSNYLNEKDLEGIFDYSDYTNHIDAMFEIINLI